MLGPLDRDALTEHRSEHSELCAAETCTGLSGLADRAVVLDQQQVVRFTCDLGHVPLGGAHSRERSGAFGERVPCGVDRLFVVMLLSLRPERDDLVENIVTGDCPDGFYDLRGQLAVTVREKAVRAPGEPPAACGAPRRSGPLVGHRDEVFCGQAVQVLAHRVKLRQSAILVEEAAELSVVIMDVVERVKPPR